MRLGAIEALGTIRDQRSLKPLIFLLEHDQNIEVRWVAAIALGSLGSPEAIDPLTRALKDPDRYVRYGAAQALKALSWVPGNDTDRAYYYIALEDWTETARMGAAATGPLIETLRDHDAATRVKVVELLSGIGDTACTPGMRTGTQRSRQHRPLESHPCRTTMWRADHPSPLGVVKAPAPRAEPMGGGTPEFPVSSGRDITISGSGGDLWSL